MEQKAHDFAGEVDQRRPEQTQQEGYHQGQPHNQHAQQRLGAGVEAVKVEKLDLTDDDISLDDTLDHVAEMERFAADDRAAAAEIHSLQIQQQQRMSSFAAAVAAQQSEWGILCY